MAKQNAQIKPESAKGINKSARTHANNQELRDTLSRVNAFDQCHTTQPLTLTDEELRTERLKTRYGARFG